MGREILGQKRRIFFFRLLPLPEIDFDCVFFSFQLQQAAVGAAATTMAECERQFERLLTRGTYSLLRYRYRWMGDIITWKLWTLQKRGGGEHTHVWVITVPSERINSGDPRQFTNAGRGEASIAIHTHTHTHTRSLHTRNSYKVHMKRWRRRRNFFFTASSVMDWARQKQRALVLVFLSNFPVIHLPLNTKW